MKLTLAIVVIALALTALGCGRSEGSESYAVQPYQDPIKGDIVISATIEKNGVNVNASDILIKNFHKGAQVGVIYRIKNDSGKDVTPTVYYNREVDPDAYPKAVGYERAPLFVKNWITISETLIEDGKTADVLVQMAMPENIKAIPNKLTFRTGVAGNNGGMYQTAVETWWLVSMR